MAAAAVTNQALRVSRVLALFSVTVFFLFLQSGAAAVASTSDREHAKAS